MKFIVSLILIFSFTLLFAAEFEITSKIKENPAHLGLQMLDKEYKYDNNGDLCTLLIVRCGVKDINFENTASKVAQIDKQGEYYITMKKGARYIVLKKDGFGSFKEQFGLVMKSGSVYEMSADEKFKQASQIPVMITCNQNGAEVLVDGKTKGTTQNKMLTVNTDIGSHKIKVTKSGFSPQEIEEKISVQNNSFNIVLQEIEPIMLTIKSNPKEATIFINNVEEGKTNKQLFKFPGEYTLKLMKSKYGTIEKTITITESGNNLFEYYLVKSTVMLTISVTPSDADIYLNNEKLSYNTKEISPGRYKIEVSKEGYFPENKTIDVLKGKDVTENFTLLQKTGKLQFIVEPMEANVTLKKNHQTIDSWTGSKMKNNLPVGEYEITASLNNYENKTKKCTIEIDKTAKVNITLEKGTRVGLSSQLDSSSGNMVFVQGGSFQMGSNNGQSDEKPVHSVTVSDFYIVKYEVTQKEWRDIMGSNPSKWKGDNLPVEKVSWDDVQTFIKKLNAKTGLNYRLPTEAEWEYAARGGNKSNGYKYSGSNDIGSVAWYASNSGSKTHSVGQKKPNELGIYDMTGNVWEWCNDWYGDYSSSSQ